MAAMTPIKFVVGSKVLLSVNKRLETVSLTLPEVIDGESVALPALANDQDGYRILSAPKQALPLILQDHPNVIAGAVQTYRRHYIDMSGSFDDYMGRFSSKTRSTLRRKHRKLIKDIGGEVEFREYRTPEEIDQFRDLAIPLSRRTYQAKSLNAGLPEDNAGHAIRRELAAQDKVRAYLLLTDGQPVSYLYLPIEGETISYAFLGYDPDYARLSPGTILQLEALNRLFAEQRYRYFDFTEGEGAHKAMFGTDSVEACSFFLLKSEVANRMLLKSVDAFDASIAGAKSLAERTGSLSKIRQLIRSR